jgi:Subtilase family/SdrD B-like domain
MQGKPSFNELFDFGSYQPGVTKGSKWNDQNGNDTWDKGEPGLAGTKIFLDQNQNGQFNVGERSTVTDDNGNYSFPKLSPGTYYCYDVKQIYQSWRQVYLGSRGVSSPQPLEAILESITTTDSTVPIYKYGEVVPTLEDTNIAPLTNVSSSLINLDKFRADPRFTGINGKGFSTVVLDTGIDLDHPFFGGDKNKDGVADRIVYQYDFAYRDADASDVDGHGSNVSSIIASSDGTYTGMAPEANIIALKVLKDTDKEINEVADVEKALQWVVKNAATYNIASVNMSLGNGENYNTPQTRDGIDDELKALAAMGVIVVSASGNDFFRHNSIPGVSYPAADPNSLSIGAVFDSDSGPMAWKGGAVAYTSGSDRIAPFSQRHPSLTTVFAPGAPITGAGANGDLVTQTGTSQAAPHIAGIAVLAQQLAEQKLGRRLTVSEFENLLTTTGVTINDGDDEDDNVTNTGLNFKRVDVKALGEAILKMADEGTVGVHKVTVSSGQIVEGINFGNTQVNSSQNWGFEIGNFKDWKTIGNATIQTAAFGINPTEGKYQALITTGSGSVSDAQMENVLGLTNGKLDSLLNGNATEGSAIQLATITAKKGDVLTLDYNFMTNESSPSNYKDSAFLTISSNQVSKLADTNSNLSRSTNSFGLQTGYNTFTYQFDRDGTYTVGIGVVDAEDTAVDSALLVDNVTLEEPRKFGFEPGDITNWEAKGDVSIQTAEFGISPTEGQYQALIKTSDSSVTDAELETFLGLQTGKLYSLLNGNATQGSAFKLQTITVQAGDILKFDWNFDTQLENVLGLTNRKLDSLLNESATEGSAIQLTTITAQKGDVLTWDFNFIIPRLSSKRNSFIKNIFYIINNTSQLRLTRLMEKLADNCFYYLSPLLSLFQSVALFINYEIFYKLA